MESFILFSDTKCVSIGKDTLVKELPFVKELAAFQQEQALFAQVSAPVNAFFTVASGLRGLYFNTELKDFTTFGVAEQKPIVIGTKAFHDIVLPADSGVGELCVWLFPDALQLVAGDQVYLNGKKLTPGTYPMPLGSGLWVGDFYLIWRGKYLTCGGGFAEVRLNIAVYVPKRYENFPYYTRSPRIIKRQPSNRIELKGPTERTEKKKGELVGLIIPPLIITAVP